MSEHKTYVLPHFFELGDLEKKVIELTKQRDELLEILKQKDEALSLYVDYVSISKYGNVAKKALELKPSWSE